MERKTANLLFLLFALTACNGGVSGSESSSSNGIEPGPGGIVLNDGKPLRLLFDLNGLMPTSNTEPTEQQPTVFRSIQDIADEFCEFYPNVTIDWAYSKKTVGDWAQWMTNQVATNDAPDIVMMHGSEYSDRNWFCDLTDTLDEPNIFIEEGQDGSEHWKDLFPDYMWLSAMTTDANNHIVAVPVTCYPGTATAYFYNKEIFDELHLNVPKTWEDLKDITKTIREAGYVAIAPWSLNAKANVDVWDIQFSLGPTYAEKIRDQWDYDGNGYMTQNEKLRATYEGVFYGQGKNYANILSLYSEVKYKYDEMLDTGAGNTDYQPMWTSGKVAMMEDGMWRINEENVDAARKFEYGIFPTPLANSTTSEFTADFEIGDMAYNPPIAESFNICRLASEQKGEAHFLASKLFLMYLTTPANINRMVDELAGDSIGAVKHTIIPAPIQDYIRGQFPRSPNCSWTSGVTVETQTKMSRYFQYWIAGRYDNARFFKNYDSELHRGAVDMIGKLGVDTTGWVDGYNPDFDYSVLA
ncbi:MAG: ABC transporter substrate-binding protein [Candidatus Enteromonas sp.]